MVRLDLEDWPAAPGRLAYNAPTGPRVVGSVELPLALLAGTVQRAPPSELQALLAAVGQGRPLDFYVRD